MNSIRKSKVIYSPEGYNMLFYKGFLFDGIFLLEKGKRFPNRVKYKVIKNLDNLDLTKYKMFYTPSINPDNIVYWNIKFHGKYNLLSARSIMGYNEDFLIGDKNNEYYIFTNCNVEINGGNTVYIHEESKYNVIAYIPKKLKVVKNIVYLDGGTLKVSKEYKKYNLESYEPYYFFHEELF